MEKEVAGGGSWTTFLWGVPALLWQVLFFYTPLIFLLGTSFIKQVSETSYVFTLEHYKALINPLYIPIFARSFFLALVAVTMCLIVAYPVAYYITLRLKRWKTFCFALLILPFWTNFLLLVYAWYFLLERDGLVNSVLLKLGLISEPLFMMHTQGAVLCGMFYCYLPFMLLPLYSAFERFDERLLDASSDLGATDWQTFTRIMLPLTLPGIKTGALLVFIPAFGEFVIPALLGGDKQMYIGSVITHYFLAMRDVPMGSAFTCVASCALVLALLVIFVTHFLLRKGDQRG